MYVLRVFLPPRVRFFAAIYILAAAPWLFLAPSSFSAQQTGGEIQEQVAATGTYWALFIGIDKYKHVDHLETAVKDAQAVRDVLIERYGFRRDRILELYDEEATRSNIEDKLELLGQQAEPDDSIFIYYAGHGITDKARKRGWWVPVEGRRPSFGTLINNMSIRDAITAMQAKHVYLVADSCFAGTLLRTLPPLASQAVDQLYKTKSRWGLTSGSIEPVQDGGRDGHSLFAYYFIKLLKENKQPYLLPSHIYDQLLPLVGNNTEQTPQSRPIHGAGDDGGQFVFWLNTHSGGSATASLVSNPQLDEVTRLKDMIERLERELQGFPYQIQVNVSARHLIKYTASGMGFSKEETTKEAALQSAFAAGLVTALANIGESIILQHTNYLNSINEGMENHIIQRFELKVGEFRIRSELDIRDYQIEKYTVDVEYSGRSLRVEEFVLSSPSVDLAPLPNWTNIPKMIGGIEIVSAKENKDGSMEVTISYVLDPSKGLIINTDWPMNNK